MHCKHAPAIVVASSTAPATGSKCKPAAAAEGTLLSFPPCLKRSHQHQLHPCISSSSLLFSVVAARILVT
ncbi:hypothetical protein Peur_030546 [Populus x canadensis]